MSSNKTATVFLVDVSEGANIDEFFEKSRHCISRTILNKILTYDNDEVALISFGDSVTNNFLNRTGKKSDYKNINLINILRRPNISLVERIKNMKLSDIRLTDWAQGLFVSLEYLKFGSCWKEFKKKQIVIFSNFLTGRDYKPGIFKKLISSFHCAGVKLVVVGVDMGSSQTHLKCIIELINSLGNSGVNVPVGEFEDSVKYFERKRKLIRVRTVYLDIGKKIRIPIGWFKLMGQPRWRMQWTKRKVNSEEGGDTNGNVKGRKNKRGKRSNEVTKIAWYGSTQVPLKDLNYLKRKSSPVFSVLMFTHRRNMSATMFVNTKLYGVIPAKGGDVASRSMLSALVDAMIEANKVAICKRILINNGKTYIGALLPFSDGNSKRMFFLRLPSAEWELPLPRYSEQMELNPLKKHLFTRLIHSMMLPEHLKGKGVLIRNPNFQMRSHILTNRILDPDSDVNIVPDYIHQLIDPHPIDSLSVCPILAEILLTFPTLSTHEQTQQQWNSQNQSFTLSSPESGKDIKFFPNSPISQGSPNFDSKDTAIASTTEGTLENTEFPNSPQISQGSLIDSDPKSISIPSTSEEPAVDMKFFPTSQNALNSSSTSSKLKDIPIAISTIEEPVAMKILQGSPNIQTNFQKLPTIIPTIKFVQNMKFLPVLQPLHGSSNQDVPTFTIKELEGTEFLNSEISQVSMNTGPNNVYIAAATVKEEPVQNMMYLSRSHNLVMVKNTCSKEVSTTFSKPKPVVDKSSSSSNRIYTPNEICTASVKEEPTEDKEFLNSEISQESMNTGPNNVYIATVKEEPVQNMMYLSRSHNLVMVKNTCSKEVTPKQKPVVDKDSSP